MTPNRRPLPVIASLLAAVALLLLALSQITLRTDMTEFLPRGTTQASRIVLDQVRDGTASGLVLIGLENDDTAHLAALSHTLAAAMQASVLFTTVAGADPPGGAAEAAIAPLFVRRYLLADADWTEPALRQGLERLLRQLQGAAAPLVLRYAIADPPGATLDLIRAWTGASQVRGIDGVWFAPDRDRALLVARTKAGAMDVKGQEAAIGLIERAFADARPGTAKLLLTGPAVFARDAARAIKGDVERLTLLSTVLVGLLLWWRFRSPLVIAAIASPVVASVAIAAVAVQLAFGTVHGVALGFGATMLGVSVDYPVLMLGHRKQGEAAPATRARIGRAFLLAVLIATLGLSSMLFSGLPGLRQLGLFSAVGLVACAALTWFGLPALIVAANLAPAAAGDPTRLLRIEHLRRYRVLAIVPVALAALTLAATGGPNWQFDLAALSPVPEHSRALDRTLRAELGAPDAGQLLLVGGADPEAVLEDQERLLPTLERLRADGVIAGMDAAALLLPSAARQRHRVALIPDRPTLQARIDAVRADLPFRDDAFNRFLDDAEASRILSPLTLPDLAGTPLRARLEPLLLRDGPTWRGPLVLHGVTDPVRLEIEIHRADPAALYLDMGRELGRILAAYTTRTWRFFAAIGVLMLAVLAIGLPQPAMALRVLAAVLAAMLVTVAVLTALGETLSLIHLVALQLVAGVGLDYALFFARRQLDAEERARTLRTLVTCNAMTLLTFGLLAFSATPLLRDIGVTVACGAVLAMAFAFFFTGEAA